MREVNAQDRIIGRALQAIGATPNRPSGRNDSPSALKMPMMPPTDASEENILGHHNLGSQNSRRANYPLRNVNGSSGVAKGKPPRRDNPPASFNPKINELPSAIFVRATERYPQPPLPDIPEKDTWDSYEVEPEAFGRTNSRHYVIKGKRRADGVTVALKHLDEKDIHASGRLFLDELH